MTNFLAELWSITVPFKRPFMILAVLVFFVPAMLFATFILLIDKIVGET